MISDDEANSWDDDLSESDESDANYYDEEDDEESPTKKEEGVDEDHKDEDADNDENEGGRLVMNVHCTEYDIIKKVARKGFNFKLRYYNEDHDGAIRRG